MHHPAPASTPQVEARAPLVSAQLAEARAALAGDLALSGAAAAALAAVAPERRGLGDEVRLALHAATAVSGFGGWGQWAGNLVHPGE